MTNGVQIFQGQTSDAYSVGFWTRTPISYRQPNSVPVLGIYGVLGGATFQLQWQAPDNQWYDSHETAFDVPALGLYTLPICGEIPWRLRYIAGNGSEISAFVYDGQFKDPLI